MYENGTDANRFIILEHDLRDKLHGALGAILDLEYIKAMQSQEINDLMAQLESLSKDHIDILQDLEDTASDLEDTTSDLEDESVYSTLFDDMKIMVLKEYSDVDPYDVDRGYIKSAFRYLVSALDDPRALLSKSDKHKIELAESILAKLGIERMAQYEEFIYQGLIDLDISDRRIKER